MRKAFSLVTMAILLTGCGTTERYPAIPSDLDRSKVEADTVQVSARRYIFDPEEIHVKAGRLLVIKITATDVTHGIEFPAFDIDERLEKGVTKVIEFYIPKPGTYDFKCSHFCGLGHFGMDGKVIAK